MKIAHFEPCLPNRSTLILLFGM